MENNNMKTTGIKSNNHTKMEDVYVRVKILFRNIKTQILKLQKVRRKVNHKGRVKLVKQSSQIETLFKSQI